jgi:hypothetical protein
VAVCPGLGACRLGTSGVQSHDRPVDRRWRAGLPRLFDRGKWDRL